MKRLLRRGARTACLERRKAPIIFWKGARNSLVAISARYSLVGRGSRYSSFGRGARNSLVGGSARYSLFAEMCP